MTKLRVSLLLSLICLLLYPVPGTGQEVLRYKVDADWPGVLPFSWSIGMINGLAVGPDNHIWVLHDPYSMQPDEIGAAQNPPRSECCYPAPEVLEFDRNGKVLRAWHGRSRISTWPVAAHGISVDKKGNVWIAGVGREWHPDLPGFTMVWDALGNPIKLARRYVTVRCSSLLLMASCSCKSANRHMRRRTTRTHLFWERPRPWISMTLPMRCTSPMA